MVYDLKDKVCVVTGGNRGVGKAVAKIFGEKGAKTVIVARNEVALQQTADEIKKTGGRCDYYSADLSDKDEIKQLFRQILKTYGRLDVLVNNAAIASYTPSIAETTLEEWNSVIAIDLTAVFLCCKEAFEIMKRQDEGKIINVSSTSGSIASSSGEVPYRAAKHGLMGLTKVLLKESQSTGISVTAIVPSHIKTEQYRKGLDMLGKPWTEQMKKEWEDSLEAEDVAEVILFAATRDKKVIVPKIAVYPRKDIHKYGMDV
jgi:NAD(P)-dependent dehydrogenase (short-subunit alcohol dehydrogenase family)